MHRKRGVPWLPARRAEGAGHDLAVLHFPQKLLWDRATPQMVLHPEELHLRIDRLAFHPVDDIVPADGFLGKDASSCLASSSVTFLMRRHYSRAAGIGKAASTSRSRRNRFRAPPKPGYRTCHETDHLTAAAGYLGSCSTPNDSCLSNPVWEYPRASTDARADINGSPVLSST